MTNWAERQRATAEAFADPKPGDRFHEMYSFWMVVVSVGADGVKVMAGSGPTNIVRGQFPDGEIVEPFAERARVRWFATADDFRAAYRNTAGWTLTLSDRGRIDVTGWLARATDRPDAPTDPKPKPAPDPAEKAFGILRDLRRATAELKPSDARRVMASVSTWLPGSDRD